VYELALPVLERKGIPAAMFVVTELVGRPAWQIHDKLYHLVGESVRRWDDPRSKFADLLSELGLPTQEFTRRSVTATPMTAVSALLPGLPQSDIRRVMTGLESSVGNGVPQRAVDRHVGNDWRHASPGLHHRLAHAQSRFAACGIASTGAG
jgi:peptidoglycan/xylan/chitin deacetylase (PgdA/CDA1 family)